ncbi:MAG: methyltransferase domain-containing protein [Leptolyngbya sp. SIO3F4]|nr:methyltransferase domain-containing protein [Leptolyngbya sp. SIO3F4]
MSSAVPQNRSRWVEQWIQRYRRMRADQRIRKQGHWLHIDSPEAETVIDNNHALLQGFLLTPPGTEVVWKGCHGKREYPVLSQTRTDLKVSFPAWQAHPFQVLIEAGDDSHSWVLEASLNGQNHTWSHAFRFSTEAADRFQEAKRTKLEAIRPLFKEEIPSVSDRNYNSLTDALREQGGVRPTGNISAHAYDERAMACLESIREGWILDNGCGLRGTYYSRVVNYEIVDYPTTDVLGIGEHLPFKDNVFEAVFSLNVLEHVRDPFQCAREIHRVLKPGGVAYVAVPFLQPFHGYPNHYYNMTSEGLKNLFSAFQVEASGVVPAGQPIHSLTWFLRSYLAGLPEEEARKFGNMRVADLAGDPSGYLDAPFVKQLSETTQDELASVNFVLARKSAD